ncbi:hypothetical protein LINGRAHAP2_LOCUS5607, partial [Linum grandiflorum]
RDEFNVSTVLREFDWVLEDNDGPKPNVKLQSSVEERQIILFCDRLALSKDYLSSKLWDGLKCVQEGRAFRPGLYACFLYCKRLSVITKRKGEADYFCLDLYEDGTYSVCDWITEHVAKIDTTTVILHVRDDRLYVLKLEFDRFLESWCSEFRCKFVHRKWESFSIPDSIDSEFSQFVSNPQIEWFVY